MTAFDPMNVTWLHDSNVPNTAKKWLQEALDEKLDWIIVRESHYDTAANGLEVRVTMSDVEEPPKLKVRNIHFHQLL